MSPTAIAVDRTGNGYVTDGWGYVEKVTPSGMLSIVAGDGDQSGDVVAGPALNTSVIGDGIAVDGGGDVYCSDAQNVVEITSAGALSIVAGDGKPWATPVPGPALASPMSSNGLAIDASGNVYAADSDPTSGAAYVLKFAQQEAPTSHSRAFALLA